ncbi:MAG TPA: serine/threonine-protein kinase [Thermoanaerobaculia bacterium]|nr:serine/threonine-protein kinase [Thermoanaerobaculia bacterium]
MRGERAGARGNAPQGWSPGGDPLLDSMVAHYRILGLLGRGGMGVVYRALDTRSGREVALKLLAGGVRDRGDGRDERDGSRFRLEARAAASLDHPNIAKVQEIGEHEGHPFLVMPLYEGETLKKRLDRAEEIAPMPLSEIVSVAAQLASALETAHSAGIVHRDLKPANLMLTRGGRMKLLDFGLALWEGSSRLTDVGRAVGTLTYMAPEQLRGEEVDARADLWAFGAVLYEMLAGRPPFLRNPNQSLQEQMRAVLEQEAPSLRDIRPDTPAVLERIIERCLAKNPADRYPTAGEIVNELQGAALLTDPHPRPDRQGGGLRPWLLLTAAVLLVGAIAVVQELLPGKQTVRVTVLPSSTPGLSGEAEARIASDLQRALREALREMNEVALIEERGAAEEHLASRIYCGPDVCQVVLHRLSTEDGRELWSDQIQVPATRPANLVAELASRLRKAYPARRE